MKVRDILIETAGCLGEEELQSAIKNSLEQTDEEIKRKTDTLISSFNCIQNEIAINYQMPEKEFEIFEEDFTKTVMDYLMYQEGISAKEFSEDLIDKVLYSSLVNKEDQKCVISFRSDDDDKE